MFPSNHQYMKAIRGDKALRYCCKAFQKSPCGTRHRGLAFPLPSRQKFIKIYRGSEPDWTDRAVKRCTATIPSFKLHIPRSQRSLSAGMCRSKPWLLKFLHCLTPFAPIPVTPAPASRGRHFPPPDARPPGNSPETFPAECCPFPGHRRREAAAGTGHGTGTGSVPLGEEALPG